MNKKILSVVLILCVMLAVMPMTAYAANIALCRKCGQIQTVRVTYQYANDKLHRTALTCTVCDNTWDYWESHMWSGTATCTSGRTCTDCGGSSEPLGHDWGAWTQNSDEKTHTRICKRDTSHTETENCHGGTATCTHKAVCEVCGGEYGEMAAHSFTAEKAEAQYLKSAATCTEKAIYYKSCAVCGLSSEGTADEATFLSGNALDHNWGDWTQNSDEETHTRICKRDTSHTETENCIGGTATCTQRATCTVCGAEYGDALGHDFTTSWTHDDNEHWKQCSRCDAKDDVSPHTWDSGTITTAPTCTKAGKKTYSCTKCDATKIEPIPATGHSWKSDWTSDATHHWYECDNKNCDVTDNAGKKGYAEHSGGKATCTQNAVCEFCKAEYGEKLPHDFTAETVDAKYLKSAATCTEKAVYYKSCAVCGLSSEGTADEATFFSGNALDHNWGAWTSNEDGTHTRTCTVDGCSAGTQRENCIDANKDHKCDICDYIISECADDNKDHKCDYCGKKLTEHTGGKATCKDKAKCEVCGAEYGELDAKNHTNLKHFPATAATKTTEGNIEYWYCEGCGKYYSDKDGTKGIKKADTVTAKLKDDSKSPQTGDTSNLALWIALLFVSGGAAIGTTVVSRKKKYNR